MTNTITSTQHKAAKIAGFMLLFFIIASMMHYTLIELNIIVSNNLGEIVKYIQTNEMVFRFGIVGDLTIFIGGIILAMALYSLLKSVNKDLALFALIFMVVANTISTLIEFSSFLGLFLASSKNYLLVFNAVQIQALLGLFLEVRAIGYTLTIIFFNISFIIFSFLFLKSKYIPKLLAIAGLIFFPLMLISSFLAILFPSSTTDILNQISSSLVMLIILIWGIWLVIKGIKK